jgi:hypothetical protein
MLPWSEPNTNESAVIVGNSIASLVSISELKRTQKKIIWIQDGMEVQGIWRGFQYEGRIVDLGMINLELDLRHPDQSQDILTYDQYSINHCAKFVNEISNFVESLTQIKELPDIFIFENGNYYQDHLISNNFSDLKRFQRLTTRFENISDGFHPKLKYDHGYQKNFIQTSYGDYVSRVYGRELSELLFLNWGRKLIGERINEINTLRHRAAWMPLPYPETIYDAIMNEQTLSKSYKFHYPKHVTFSEMVRDLFNNLNNDVSITKIPIQSLDQSSFEDLFNSRNQVLWASKLEKFLELVRYDEEYKVSNFRSLISIAIFEVEFVDSLEKYVVLNNDSVENAWYRFTLVPNIILKNNRRIMVIESAGDHVEIDHELFFHQTSIKLKKKIKSFQSIPALLTLNGSKYENYREWHSNLVSSFPNVELVGNSAFAYSSTFNDQVVQGLKFASKDALHG